MIKPSVEVHQMSDLDIRALEANFTAWKTERAPFMPDDKAFEWYAVDQVLKDRDLSDEEIASGNLGGGDDGGVDAIYLFIGDQLVRDENTVYRPSESVELVLVQATRETGFKEERIEKFHAFCRDLFDFTKPADSIVYLNSMARDAISRFRKQYDSILATNHTLTITFHYVCKSTKEPVPNDKVTHRAANLIAFVRSMLSAAKVSIDYWTSQKLLASARRNPASKVIVPVVKVFQTDDTCAVCLIKLKDYAAHILQSESGKLNTRIFEPNVRDYLGPRNPVNDDIRTTLAEAAPREDFWWLNNGITIVATSCSLAGNKLSIGDPEVVNGLQTSHEIFGQRPSDQDPRTLLVRVIIPTDERSRIKIIKATNYQTEVKDISLRANDTIHLDIEDRLKLYNLFYDRKRGEYRRLRKPLSQIVGPEALSQSVIAIALQKPDEARARPLTYLNSNYMEVFDEKYDKDVYATCILIDRQVMAYLEVEAVSKDEKRDLRYYVGTIVCSKLSQKSHPSISEIAALVSVCVLPIDPTILEFCADTAITVYKKMGATDKIAKSVTMRTEMLNMLEGHFGV
jgi:hypothetical protein